MLMMQDGETGDHCSLPLWCNSGKKSHETFISGDEKHYFSQPKLTAGGDITTFQLSSIYTLISHIFPCLCSNHLIVSYIQ